MKRAIVSAAALEVVCPHCTEAQPNPEDGSHMWSHSQLRAAYDKNCIRTCISCGKEFTLHTPRTVEVE